MVTDTAFEEQPQAHCHQIFLILKQSQTLNFNTKSADF